MRNDNKPKQNKNCHTKMAVMERSSRLVCNKLNKEREQSTMRREDAMGIALSARGMIGTMLASLYRARKMDSLRTVPSIPQGLYTGELICTCLGTRTIQVVN